MKKIGILGSGQVGKTLAKAFLKYNYPVKIGSRSEEKQQKLQDEIDGDIQVGDFLSCAAFGDIIILAVKGSVALETLRDIGSDRLSGKVIIDATNPIADAPPQNGVLRFFTSLDKSLMEMLQDEFPNTHFVKAFNSIGSALMVNPVFRNNERATMFICGNSAEAKAAVTEINGKFGFETEDMGAAEAARAIEPLCMLWCIPGFKDNSWSHAFRLIRV
jgi:predicted dinucleotide-binding enzyme